MSIVFDLSAAIAVIATVLVITRSNAVHALLYLIVSLLAVAIVLYTLGAPFAAALEVIIYAGAIMVLFVFVVMMLNLSESADAQEQAWMGPRIWGGPALLSLVLLGELTYVLVSGGLGQGAALINGARPVSAKQVGMLLFGPYLLTVELGSMLLLAGLVGAFHLARSQAAPPDVESRQ